MDRQGMPPLQHAIASRGPSAIAANEGARQSQENGSLTSRLRRRCWLAYLCSEVEGDHREAQRNNSGESDRGRPQPLLRLPDRNRNQIESQIHPEETGYLQARTVLQLPETRGTRHHGRQGVIVLPRDRVPGTVADLLALTKGDRHRRDSISVPARACVCLGTRHRSRGRLTSACRPMPGPRGQVRPARWEQIQSVDPVRRNWPSGNIPRIFPAPARRGAITRGQRLGYPSGPTSRRSSRTDRSSKRRGELVRFWFRPYCTTMAFTCPTCALRPTQAPLIQYPGSGVELSTPL